MNKFEYVRNIILSEPVNNKSLLDVGCRGCELKSYVGDVVAYKGVDLFQNPSNSVDYVLDVENGLPMENSSSDYVVALDLVEHLNDFQGGLEELLRVAREKLIVMLPNMAHWVFRKEFLFHGRIGAKYDLSYGMGKDRHRWFTVLPQTDEYIKRFCDENNLELQVIWFNGGRKKELFYRVTKFLGFPPSIGVWASLYIMKKMS
ncbi:MAG: methyltransferase domain-containing protein [Gammaproteobacteria bacterium]|nr:methyltransferase domain-containing protein [Gammaproteobacteria bacterium]